MAFLIITIRKKAMRSIYQAEKKPDVLPVTASVALLIASLFIVSACSDSGNNDGAALEADGANAGQGVADADSSGAGAENDDELFVEAVDPNEAIPAPSADTIATSLLNNDFYGILLSLIEQADLAGALNEDSSGSGWTLFAPSDRVFENDAAYASLSTEQKNELVRNHLYAGRLSSAELTQGTLAMSSGSVTIGQASDGRTTVGGARIVAADREFSNGFIHFVDAVLQAD